MNFLAMLEPVCCKKPQKIVPDQWLVWGPLKVHKLVTGQELFFAVSYSKPALPRNTNWKKIEAESPDGKKVNK